jgi:carbon monoxide dehydrogenase subunit G
VIETEQSILIDAPIGAVWNYVSDIRQWAAIFPGCRDCAVINEHDSRWTLKVGAGGLVRTVNVLVHVDEWNGPNNVNFTFKLEGDPVEGSGSYFAARKENSSTEITLKVCVSGTGSMAPMWEAMSKPLLPQLAKSFAGQLKVQIENANQDIAPIAAEASSWFSATMRWLKHLLNLRREKSL